MTRIGLISDTHGFLDEAVFKHFENCDEIWHAGDFGEGFEGPEPINIMVEVMQHIGEGRVRCVALQPTDGLVRGMKCISTGA